MDTGNSRIVVELQGILGDGGLEARLRSRSHTSSDAERLESVYRAVFGERINRTCGNCLYDAYIILKINAKKDMENVKERIDCGFALKAGVILRIPSADGGVTLYSNRNLTDAVATAWLREHPNTIRQFAKVPDGFLDGLRAGAEASADASAEPAAPDAEPEDGVVEQVKAAKTAKNAKKTGKKSK